MSDSQIVVWEGRAYPLGATPDPKGVNFALFSANAERVELCLFDSTGQTETARIPMRFRTGNVWHGYVAGCPVGQLYGYRVYGPYNPRKGHRFNGNKLLIDPYAKHLQGEIRWDERLYSHPFGDREHLWPDTRDSESCVPKSVVVDDRFDWEDDVRPQHSIKETILYEVHVKGYTQLHPEVPPAHRGTYLGLAAPSVIAHLKNLGVTAVELLPCQAFFDEPWLNAKGLKNYWGYNPLAYFAPTARYASQNPLVEFKQMVKALHQAGIEVILDVVYNHTCETGSDGPTLCFRGIDNSVYYRLVPSDQREYLNYAGCGNTLNTEHPQVLKLMADSLRYWVEEMHVDGFRFDLAPVLGRDDGRFSTYAAFFDIVHQDPVLSQVKMIAEPWDIGPDGYQLGNFPTGWREWNDKFRDTIRAFWRGEGGLVGALAERMSGSSDLFRRRGRRPTATINFITAHDGFTLHDSVSYQEKHNWANGEDNRDGHGHNITWNCGAEGPTRDPQILALRLRQKKNMLVTLFLSQGVPMLLGGDEMGRTQQGNNNTYCQDNELNWQNWQFDSDGEALLQFTRQLIALRKAHSVFCRHEFLNGIKHRGAKYKDVTWLHPSGREMNGEDWHQWECRSLGILLAGDSLPDIDDHGLPVQDNNFLLLLNAHYQDIEFRLASTHQGTLWELVFDTSINCNALKPVCYASGATYLLKAHSSCLLIEQS